VIGSAPTTDPYQPIERNISDAPHPRGPRPRRPSGRIATKSALVRRDPIFWRAWPSAISPKVAL